MPEYGIHLTVLDKTVDKLKTAGRADLAAVMETADRKYAALGAIGPDMFFFTADYGDLQKYVNFVMEIYETLEPIIEFFEEVSETLNTMADMITEGTWNSLKGTGELLIGVVTAMIEKIVIQRVNFFPFFQSKLSMDLKETDWYWIDMLHYRRTGEFADNMVALAREWEDNRLLAYAYGYLTHFATDVVGHPFVNQIVGAPYRNMWQRHHLVENFMDVWAYGRYHTAPGDLTTAGGEPNFAAWANLNDSKLADRLDLEDDEDGKDKLMEFITEALRRTYTVPNDPRPNRGNGPNGDFNVEDVTTTYELMIAFLKKATGRGLSIPAPQEPAVIPYFYWPEPPDSGSRDDDAGDSGSDFCDAIESIFEWILYGLEVLAALLAAPYEVIVGAGTYPLRYLLYLIQLQLYNLYRQIKWAAVLAGYVTCEPDELATPEARQLIRTPGKVDVFPHQEDPAEEVYLWSGYNPLPFPTTPQEPPPAEAGVYFNELPDAFMETKPFDPANGILHRQAAYDAANQTFLPLVAGSPVATHGPTPIVLGNAIDNSAQLIENADGGGQTPNMNLDADRGYAWPTWEPVPGTSLRPGSVIRVQPRNPRP